MALAKTVTKAFPSSNMVGIHLKVTDDDRADLGSGPQTVIDADFMENFTAGTPTPAVKMAIGAKAQKAIDEYKKRRTWWAAAAYETMRSQVDAGLSLLIFLALFFCLFTIPESAEAALTITASSDTDWTAVAAADSGASTDIDISGSYTVAIQIQAFLDSTTAHEGTEFLIQTSFNTTGDEDWSNLTRFTELVGTADSEAITNNPLAAGSTTITVASTIGYTMDLTSMRWVAIEDATLINSELVLQEGFTANTNITILDGTTNAHVLNTLMYNIAFSKTIMIPFGSGSRARVVVNNKYDDDAISSSLNFRVRKVLTTGL